MKSEDAIIMEILKGAFDDPLISISREAREKFCLDLDQRSDPLYQMHGMFSWN